MKIFLFFSRLADSVYRSIFSIYFLLQTWLCLFVPLIGRILHFFHLCLLFSLTSFEYRWLHIGWSVNKRIDSLQSDLFYFSGFGFPAAVLASIFPVLESGVISLLLPFGIMMATGVTRNSDCNKRFPILKIVQSLTDSTIIIIGWLLQSKALHT